MGMIEKLRRWWSPRPSNLVGHAERELAIAFGGAEGVDELSRAYNQAVADSALQIVRLFANQDHSGFSASMVTSIVERLMRFEPLTPLTGDDDEWNEVGDGVFQNRRCSHVFKENGEAYDIDGIVFREPSGACFTGRDSRVPVTFPYAPTRTYVDVADAA